MLRSSLDSQCLHSLRLSSTMADEDIHNGGEGDEANPNPLMEPIYQGDIVDTVIRMDPRDIQAIIQAMEKKTTSVADQQASSSQYLFKREGFGRQFDFNSTLIKKLTPLLPIEEARSVIAEIVQSLTVRNETLKIADSHPQVFQFLDMKSKSESLKAMDPKLSEFVESIKKKEQDDARKRKAPSQYTPFHRRDSAWRPVSLSSRMPTEFASTSRPSYSMRRTYSYARPQPSPYRSSRNYRSYYEEAENRRKSSCNLCGREGHWQQECPQNK